MNPITTLFITLSLLLPLSLLPFSLLPHSYYHTLFLSLSSNSSAASHLRTLTRLPHSASTLANAAAAEHVVSALSAAGVNCHVAEYEVLLSFPVRRSLELRVSEGEKAERFGLQQEVYEGDPYADVAGKVLPTFHAYAKSGTVSGPVAYVNYGRVEDYVKLNELGINVTGAIALARYGRVYRGDIVENAYNAGAIGAVIFTDRKDYGSGGGSTEWFPNDKGMPPTGVQVGSVYNGAGDPTTPGWPSTVDCERLSDDEVANREDIPHIPSLPVSWTDGEKILRAIGGYLADDDWQGGVNGSVYKVGPGPGILNLSYEGKNAISKIQNVIGVIEGREEPDRYVILGNHRDAWTFGAVDPNSGTAALLELAERLGKLQKLGWKPRRTILFCNWDAEEYGLIGSVEWVEENRELLYSRAVAYLNVDVGVGGSGFQVAATPQLDELIKQSAQKVQDPDNATQTIYEAWQASNDSTIDRLGGAGSDYSAFVQHIGVPSADMSFGDGYPVYHSLYDDFVWMEKFGDPMFHRHVAVASIWGYVALRLADEEILPFDYLSYAYELEKSAEELKRNVLKENIELNPLFKSIEKLKKAAAKINHQKKVLEKKKGWVSWWKTEGWKLRELNDRLMMTERAFTDRDGLSGRPWYKHLIYDPSRHNDYGSQSFPGIDDEIENAKQSGSSESWRAVQHEVWRVARAITHASLVLNGKLT